MSTFVIFLFENHNENEKVNWLGEIENDNSRHLRKYLRKYDDTDNETRRGMSRWRGSRQEVNKNMKLKENEEN